MRVRHPAREPRRVDLGADAPQIGSDLRQVLEALDEMTAGAARFSKSFWPAAMCSVWLMSATSMWHLLQRACTFSPRSSGCSQNGTSPCACATLFTLAPWPSWHGVQPNLSGGCWRERLAIGWVLTVRLILEAGFVDAGGTTRSDRRARSADCGVAVVLLDDASARSGHLQHLDRPEWRRPCRQTFCSSFVRSAATSVILSSTVFSRLEASRISLIEPLLLVRQVVEDLLALDARRSSLFDARASRLVGWPFSRAWSSSYHASSSSLLTKRNSGRQR